MARSLVVGYFIRASPQNPRSKDFRLNNYFDRPPAYRPGGLPQIIMMRPRKLYRSGKVVVQ
jgi:hypothetical protein